MENERNEATGSAPTKADEPALTEATIRGWLAELPDWQEEKRQIAEGQDRENLTIFRRGEQFFLVLYPSDPLRLEVEVDPKLGRILVEQYETAMWSKRMGFAWLEVVLTGQIASADVKSLVLQSYHLNAPAATADRGRDIAGE